jgi:hypothetical protein
LSREVSGNRDWVDEDRGSGPSHGLEAEVEDGIDMYGPEEDGNEVED